MDLRAFIAIQVSIYTLSPDFLILEVVNPLILQLSGHIKRLKLLFVGAECKLFFSELVLLKILLLKNVI